jgi:hypothetical protein
MRGAAEEEEVEEMLRKVLEGACSKWIRRESHIDQTLVTQETSRDIQKHPATSRNHIGSELRSCMSLHA